jgi:hypothetical protein
MYSSQKRCLKSGSKKSAVSTTFAQSFSTVLLIARGFSLLSLQMWSNRFDVPFRVTVICTLLCNFPSFNLKAQKLLVFSPSGRAGWAGPDFLNFQSFMIRRVICPRPSASSLRELVPCRQCRVAPPGSLALAGSESVVTSRPADVGGRKLEKFNRHGDFKFNHDENFKFEKLRSPSS